MWTNNKEWKGVLEKHGLRMSLEETEVMWFGHQRERGVEHQRGWLRDQASGWLCVPWRNGYRGWTFSGRSATSDTSGSEYLEKGRESHVGQKNSKQLKGKVLRTCVTPGCLYGLETVALKE